MNQTRHPARGQIRRPINLIALAAAGLVGVACSSDAVVAPPTTAAVVEAEVAAETTVATSPSETSPPTDTIASTVPVDTAAPVDTTIASAPAVLDELDDLDEDGSFDERCGTTDLGGGLVVEVLCNTGLVPTPEGGVLPLPGSLLTLPSPSRWEDLAAVDATVKVSSRPDGSRVVKIGRAHV